ncbi:MAG: tRNA pseudouridine(55) synthase TruB [Clostridia bacterium]|nr:tRNA pseudouridine(55) synthase TruB [Clostridia bacterium]
MTGILVVNKPMDYTSHDVIAILKGLTKEKKIGHTGTLDPNATGVLPVCFGKATRLIEYMEVVPKSYACTMRLGLSSDTDDIWGEVKDNGLFAFPTQEEMEKMLKSFLGDIQQIPPMYSAVCVNGRRLYSYARSGETVEVKPRKVHIYDISLTGFYPCRNEISFNITCSRGTYIRTICHDLGDMIGCGAVMSALTRTTTSGFDISEAIDFEEIRKMSAEEIASHIYTIDRAIGDMPRVMIAGKAAQMFMNGMTITLQGPDSPTLAVFVNEELVGIAKREKDKLKPLKVFL